ncbi:unnamed protein product [Lactuca virosa]|uniref:Nucleoplasmin-like domain-containing protein n=1 Tax=Lactuca virosa TaxID=75947 RepID=A0AAU9PAD2_9ASTR|nr:unnamed protein product [Lactuca virosa]
MFLSLGHSNFGRFRQNPNCCSSETMKFWGVEVKGAQRLKVKLGGRSLCLRYATIGEIKEEVAEVIVHVHGKNRKHKLATLKPRTGPQQLLDWMLEEDFTITHTLTNGSVCLLGGITRKSYKDYPYPKHATVLLS